MPLFERDDYIVERDGEQLYYQYYDDKPDYDLGDTLNRLRRHYREYASCYNLGAMDKKKKHIFKKDLKKKEESQVDHQLAASEMRLKETMFGVDFNIEEARSRYVATTSFTFLGWKLIEELEAEKICIDDIDDSMVELLCYQILPDGNTLLHRTFKDAYCVERVLQTAHPNPENRRE